MKVAILSESAADEAAIRVLVQAVLGREIDLCHPVRARPGGWPSVLNILPSEYRRLFYHTDADGLVVVVDSDDTAPHEDSHEQAPAGGCRICAMRSSLERLGLPPRPAGPPVKVAMGLCVPAIEAWYLCGLDPHAAEAPFQRAVAAGKPLWVQRNELKQRVYSTDRPSILLETQRAEEAATRLAGCIEQLERQFPLGFGLLARQLRQW